MKSSSLVLKPILISAVLIAAVLVDTASASTPNFINSERVNVHEHEGNINALPTLISANLAVISSDATVDEALANLIIEKRLRSAIRGARRAPGINEPITQLGMKLFFTKALGGEKTVACATCHHPELGGADQLSFSIGTNAIDPDAIGLERKALNNEVTIPRNAPTIFNTGLMRRTLFWDGRVEMVTNDQGVRSDQISTPDSTFNSVDVNAGDSLTAALSRFPVTSVEEMRGSAFPQATTNEEVRRHLAERIGDYGGETGSLDTNDWLAHFQQAFNSDEPAQNLITFDSIALALGQYQQSLVLVDSDWHRYLNGDPTALTDQQKRGAVLYFTPRENGGAGCDTCHGGTRFTREGFVNVAYPQFGIGTQPDKSDIGRAAIELTRRNQFAFRIPSLLNVALTAPYGHAGSFETLEQVVAHYVDPATSIEQFFQRGGACGLPQFTGNENCDELNDQAQQNSQAALNRFERSRFVKPVLNAEQQQDVVAFLHALTDHCATDTNCIQQWVPSNSSNDPDNLQLRARFTP
ncbi:cytochrome c peroxidase [Pseudoalteromonas citrea]|uniref:Cytochrome c peroxidase n=2 Tax=Pseudoalteromonas citrea TaxID=43655 RepID=A0AAD4AEF0_9GAMM|nr:cytochrome c peroxidase [Pseudoalteromonas citrea]KAF7764426.1 cytochrome c peroxidase [Pseudoalteromonas citrea]